MPSGDRRGKGQPDADIAIFQFGADCSAVGLHQLFDNGHSNAGAPVLTRTRFFAPVKPLEKKGEVCWHQFPDGIDEINGA